MKTYKIVWKDTINNREKTYHTRAANFEHALKQLGVDMEDVNDVLSIAEIPAGK